MARKPKNLYRLTKEGREDIRKRAKAEAEIYERPKKSWKIKRRKSGKFNPKKSRISKPTVGGGTHLDDKKKMVKRKKAAYTYRGFDPEDEIKGGTKETGRFDFEASTQKEFDEKLKAKKEEKGKTYTDVERPRWQGRKDMAENEKQKEEDLVYKKDSRTDDTLEKRRDISRRLDYLQDTHGKRRGKRKMYKERKKYYKSLYKKSGYLGKGTEK